MIPSVARSQWDPAAVALCDSCFSDSPSPCSDGAGGAYVVWRKHTAPSQNNSDVVLQRVTADGMIAPGWPRHGLVVCDALWAQEAGRAVPDGFGGALVVWEDFRDPAGTGADVYAQRVRADGTLAPGWPLNGSPASRRPDAQSFPQIAPDGTGGAYVVWYDWLDYETRGLDLYAQHLTATGEIAPGWPENGRLVSGEVGNQVHGLGGVIPDGEGGMVVAWCDGRRGGDITERTEIYAQRLMADGSVAPGWSEGGVLVAERRCLGSRPLVPDGVGGFYVGGATTDSVHVFIQELWAHRFTMAGTLASDWPAEGVQVCAALGGELGSRDGYTLASDSLGGVLLAWYDYRTPGGEIYASRLLPDGSLPPGWTPNGTRISDLALGPEFGSGLAPDGAGGAYVLWSRQTDIEHPGLIQHLTATGGLAPGWPEYGLRVAPTRAQYNPEVTPDGIGGAIVVWEERGVGRYGIFAQRFGPDGPTAVALSLVDAVAEPGRVRLTWHGLGAGALAATVERREEGAAWSVLGRPEPDGGDRLVYEDGAVVPGRRYAYRLAYVDEGTTRWTDEHWLDVPAAFELSLNGLQPNPGQPDRLRVAFTLASAAQARVELFDVLGRRVVARDVGGLGPGRHLLSLDGAGPLRAGVYWIRLTQAGSVRQARGVISP